MSATFYGDEISRTVEALDLPGTYDPRDVEAWMRLARPTLDGMGKDEFAMEVMLAAQCIDESTPETTARLRESYGL